MTRPRSTERLQLLNGCTCSQFSVHPKNWKDRGASIKKDWYIAYRFYDPAFKDHPKYKNGKLCPVKGMNQFQTLTERRSITQEMLEQERDLLINQHYNPITGKFMTDQLEQSSGYLIHPETPLCQALHSAAKNLKDIDENSTGKDIRSVLRYFSQAAEQIKLHTVPVKEVTRRHIKLILQQVGVIKGEKWTSNNFNFYRSYLKIVFNELVDCETIEVNPVDAIKKRKRTEPQQLRTILNEEQRRLIDQDLRQSNYRLWRFMHIFFHSGARNTEMTLVKYEDVDLKNQSCTYTVKKGRGYRKVQRPIKDIALHLWREIMLEAKPDQYLFSEGLMPQFHSIRPEQYTRRWKRWVKDREDRYGKVSDWYSLKHLNTDEMSALYGSNIAALLNAHSVDVAKKYYAVNEKSRGEALIRRSSNSFSHVHKEIDKDSNFIK